MLEVEVAGHPREQAEAEEVLFIRHHNTFLQVPIQSLSVLEAWEVLLQILQTSRAGIHLYLVQEFPLWQSVAEQARHLMERVERVGRAAEEGPGRLEVLVRQDRVTLEVRGREAPIILVEAEVALEEPEATQRPALQEMAELACSIQ